MYDIDWNQGQYLELKMVWYSVGNVMALLKIAAQGVIEGLLEFCKKKFIWVSQSVEFRKGKMFFSLS